MANTFADLNKAVCEDCEVRQNTIDMTCKNTDSIVFECDCGNCKPVCDDCYDDTESED